MPLHLRRWLARLLTLAAAALPLMALAHTGSDAGGHHAAGFVDGMLHPLTGIDHLAAMLAVGCWSAMTARRVWLAPLVFAGMLLAGALAGLQGVELPAGEPAIAASLLVLGLLVATQRALPAAAASVLVGAFAVFHGIAHGHELGGTGGAAAALAGMVLATASLHAAGIALGLVLQRAGRGPTRVAGGAVVLLGITLMVQMVHA